MTKEIDEFMSHVTTLRLKDVLGPHSLDGLRDVVAEWYEDIKNIFAHYCKLGRRDAVRALTSLGWSKFVEDCNMANKKLPRSSVDLIFLKANMEVSASNGQISSAVAGDSAMEGPEFAEALIRVILQRGFPGSCDTLKEALEYSLRFSILPNACKEDPEKFREDIGEQQVRRIFQKYEARLQVIYHYYSGKEFGGSADTMDASEFLQMAKECNLIDASLSVNRVCSLFSQVQNEEDDEDGGDTDAELSYDEFLEALAGCSVFKEPNPYLPLECKLDKFLDSLCHHCDYLRKPGGLVAITKALDAARRAKKGSVDTEESSDTTSTV